MSPIGTGSSKSWQIDHSNLALGGSRRARGDVAKTGWPLPIPAVKPDPMTEDRLNAEAAGRLGEIARRAGVERRGRSTAAGRAEHLVSAGVILAVARAAVFS